METSNASATLLSKTHNIHSYFHTIHTRFGCQQCIHYENNSLRDFSCSLSRLFCVLSYINYVAQTKLRKRTQRTPYTCIHERTTDHCCVLLRHDVMLQIASNNKQYILRATITYTQPVTTHTWNRIRRTSEEKKRAEK